jgi:UDP-galactopyranose mutase
MGYDFLIVGAGYAGSVMAERIASQLGKRVLVIDRRAHIGGNAYDELDESGVLVHRYGPHIFHTNSAQIVEYLSRFTEWRPYEHRVLARVRHQLVPIPINRTTVNRLFGLRLVTDEEVAAFYATRAEPRRGPGRTSEDVVVSAVGHELYELFFRGYTRKQWGLDPSELDASVTARVPTRTDDDDRYFTDRFQQMPRDGYTRMFERMLDHSLIDVRLGVDFRDLRGSDHRVAIDHDEVVYTGPIDEYFDARFGPLPYRSLEFRFESLPVEWAQRTGTVNEPDESVPFTRTTEFKHLTGQQHASTTIVREFPRAEGDPYYPIPRPENERLYRRYQALAEATRGVHFVGRLATYRYYNMDQVVGQALAMFKRLAERSARAA